VVISFLRTGPGCKGPGGKGAWSGAVGTLPLTESKGVDGGGRDFSSMVTGGVLGPAAGGIVTSVTGCTGTLAHSRTLGVTGRDGWHVTPAVGVAIGRASLLTSHGRGQSALECWPAHLIQTWAYGHGFSMHGFLGLLLE
jgi:hypothetical protein